VAVEGNAALLVDPGHFRQMVHNLVGNALKYGAPPVRVTVEGGGSWTTVVVQDGGEGVAPGYVPHLFERFTRGPAGSSSSAGTGLGLYLVRRLAEANGGTVRYAPGPSSGPSSGAGFVLTLPASASRAGPAMPKVPG
jgi:signal transduction histidine kinase